MVGVISTSTEVAEPKPAVQPVTATGNPQLELAILANINDAVLVTEAEPVEGPDGPRIVYVNDAFIRMTGYEAHDVLGKTPRILQGAKTDRNELDRLKAALKSWQPVRVQLTNYKKDGTPFEVEFDITPLANEAGWYTHWISVQRDVTRRRQSQDRLLHMARQLELATSAAEVGLWQYDLEAGTLEWTPLHKAMWGYDEDAKLFYEDWHRVIHPQDKEKCLAEVEAARLQRRRYEVEYRIRRADNGQLRWVRSFGHYQYNAAGGAISLTGASIDITAQKNIEQELSVQENMFRSVFAQSAIGLAFTNAQGRFLEVNKALESLIGYSSAELQSMSINEVTHPQDRAHNEQVITGLLNGTITGAVLQKRCVHKSGEVLWVRSSISVIRSADGTPVSLVVLAENITQERQAQESVISSEARFRNIFNNTTTSI